MRIGRGNSTSDALKWGNQGTDLFSLVPPLARLPLRGPRFRFKARLHHCTAEAATVHQPSIAAAGRCRPAALAEVHFPPLLQAEKKTRSNWDPNWPLGPRNGAHHVDPPLFSCFEIRAKFDLGRRVVCCTQNIHSKGEGSEEYPNEIPCSINGIQPIRSRDLCPAVRPLRRILMMKLTTAAVNCKITRFLSLD